MKHYWYGQGSTLYSTKVDATRPLRYMFKTTKENHKRKIVSEDLAGYDLLARNETAWVGFGMTLVPLSVPAIDDPPTPYYNLANSKIL